MGGEREGKEKRKKKKRTTSFSYVSDSLEKFFNQKNNKSFSDLTKQKKHKGRERGRRKRRRIGEKGERKKKHKPSLATHTPPPNPYSKSPDSSRSCPSYPYIYTPTSPARSVCT